MPARSANKQIIGRIGDKVKAVFQDLENGGFRITGKIIAIFDAPSYVKTYTIQIEGFKNQTIELPADLCVGNSVGKTRQTSH